MLIQNNKITRLRFMVFFKRHPMLLLGVPYVFLHELSHFIFIRMTSFYERVEFRVNLNSMGFYLKDMEVEVSGFFPILNLLMVAIAPMFLFILNYMVFTPPKMEYIYMLTFGMYLIPSSADIICFIDLMKQLIKR